jgi:hypothetical protein
VIWFHLVCSETDAAIDSLKLAIEQHSLAAAWYASARPLQALRASPRWPKLAKMMNLPGTA